MSNNVNLEVMELFPNPKELPDEYTRHAALVGLWRVTMAARGAIDEITARSVGLSDDEKWSSGAIAEQLSAKVAELESLLTD